MSWLGAAYNLGFIVGPALGGLLAHPSAGHAGFRIPLLIASGLSATCILGLALFLKESRVHQRIGKPPEPLGRHAQRGTQSGGRPPLLVTLLAGCAFNGIESVFGLWAQARFDWDTWDIGLAFAVTGVVAAICQIFVTARPPSAMARRACWPPAWRSRRSARRSSRSPTARDDRGPARRLRLRPVHRLAERLRPGLAQCRCRASRPVSRIETTRSPRSPASSARRSRRSPSRISASTRRFSAGLMVLPRSSSPCTPLRTKARNAVRRGPDAQPSRLMRSSAELLPASSDGYLCTRRLQIGGQFRVLQVRRDSRPATASAAWRRRP